jgi:hypothetical protein
MVGELVTKSDLVCNWSAFAYFAKKPLIVMVGGFLIG